MLSHAGRQDVAGEPLGTYPAEADSGKRAARHIKPIMQDVLAEIQRQQTQEGLVGYTTGCMGLDHNTGGIRKGELWTIGALPGKGKTACGVQILLANALAGIPVMSFSIEMSDIELGKRFLVANSNFSAGRIWTSFAALARREQQH